MKTNLLPKLYKEKPFKMQYMKILSKRKKNIHKNP